MRRFLQLLTCSVLLAGCAKYEERDLPISHPNSKGPIFHATMENRQDESRTYLDKDNHQLWHAEDEIALYYGSTQKHQYRFMGETGDPEGYFEEISVEEKEGTPLKNNYAFYPYSMVYDFSETRWYYSNGEYDDFYRYLIKLPVVQYYAPGGTFTKEINPMVATTESVEDTELNFKNICGYLKLKLYGDNITVKQIALSDNSGSVFNSNHQVRIKDGIGTIFAKWSDSTTDKYNSILLDCGEGVVLSDDPNSSTEFVFVLMPMTFAKGFRVTITDVDGTTYVKQTSKEVNIEQNIIQPMAPFQVGYISENQKIYYTTSDGKVIEPYYQAPTCEEFKSKIISNTYDTTNNRGTIVLAEELNSIGKELFARRSNLTSITLPESVVDIEEYAFNNCDALEKFDGKLASSDKRCLIVNNEIKAFAPAGLSNYTIPSNITKINPSVFQNCEELEKFYGKFASADNRCLVIDQVLINFAKGYRPANYTIPTGVTEIGEFAFSGTTISRIFIPEGVTKIGNFAFAYCRNLDFVSGCEFPSTLTTIGESAFATCDAMTAIYIPRSVTVIGANAFSNCTSLNRVIVQNAPDYGVDHLTAWCKIDFGNSESNPLYYAGRLYRGALGNYSAIKSLHSSLFSAEITEFKDYVFWGNLELTTLSFSDRIKKIGKAAFCACSNLKTIDLGSVTHIGASAFASLPLQEITIPETVTEIGASAFYNCRSLTYVYCNPTNPPTAVLDSDGEWEAFEFHNSNVFKIIVPSKDSYTEYQSASGWSEYASSISRFK